MEAISYKQELVHMLGVEVPVIINEGTEYYPISYISSKLLHREGRILQNSNVDTYYRESIRKFIVDFNFINAGKQETRCIPKEALEKYISSARTGKLDKNKKRKVKELAEYFMLNKQVVENDRFLNNYQYYNFDYGSEFIRDAIIDVLKVVPDIRWQVCNSCGIYFPFHINFFKENQRSPHGLNNSCRTCNGWDGNRRKVGICTSNPYLNSIFNKYGDEVYVMYRDKNIVAIYNHYIDNDLYKFPKAIDNRNDIISIVTHLHNIGYITKNNISIDYIKVKMRLNTFYDHLRLHDIYSALFSEDYYLYPWNYPNMKYMKQTIELNMEIAKQVLRNYIREMNIIVTDVLKFDYGELVNKCGISEVYNNDPLTFLVEFHNKEYGGYQFSIKSKKYYQYTENRVHDLKIMIEKDLKLNPDKVPLYLTMTNIINTSSTIYRTLKRYYNNIYEWVNEVYPNKYDIMDFNISVVRNVFDSAEENLIHNILKEKFKNVLYNRRNSDIEIELGGYKPDWLIFTENGCWLVEYYGMYQLESEESNERIGKYISKTKKKIMKYEEMLSYNKLYIYREDLKYNYSGLIGKLKQIN